DARARSVPFSPLPTAPLFRKQCVELAGKFVGKAHKPVGDRGDQWVTGEICAVPAVSVRSARGTRSATW
ncbi:MAG: hypothetical protein ACPHJ3_09230, partial [Rubripirellula sp.]